MNQPLSYIHPQARLADNVVVEPFVTIAKNVEIGEGTWIGPNVTILENARIGKNCKIFPGAVISAIPQDLKFAGEETYTIIGDHTTIRECATINRGTKHSNETRVGNHCLLMAYTHVAHDCQVGDHVVMANNASLAGHCIVDDYVILGGGTGVQQFTHIGAHAYVSGLALVRKDIPPFIKTAREPLSYAGVNSIGLRRRGYSKEEINHIQDIYRILFVKGYSIGRAIRIIEAEVPATAIRDQILDFIRNSKQGIVKGFFQKELQ